MAITLSANYLAEIKKGENTPNTIIEVVLDGGTQKWGFNDGGLPDVQPILKSVGSVQNKIDTKKGYSTRGQINIVISGRDTIKALVSSEYLKNRRITRKDGFLVDGFGYADYAETFTGKILDWSRKGDELSLVLGDDILTDGKIKLPVENDTKTQTLNYNNTNPVDIMVDILTVQLGISTALVDVAQFESERDAWLNSWKFSQVINKPVKAETLLNELQVETGSYIIQDGEKISYKVVAPPVPGQVIEAWTDEDHILKDSLVCKSGYRTDFYNRVVFYYNHDGSSDDKAENFENIYITIDAGSQSASEWDEAKSKVIKSKFIRNIAWTQPSVVTGVTVYHASNDNGAGAGTLTFNFTNNTLQWTAPSGLAGSVVVLDKDGQYQVFDDNTNKYIRVVVDRASLAGTDQSETITISDLQGDSYVKTVANRLLSKNKSPVASVSFEIDINNVAYQSNFIKPTDLKNLTTDEAFDKDRTTWVSEELLLTSVRPDFARSRVKVEGVQTRIPAIGGLRYGFIAPAGFPDYSSATEAQREYAFVGNSSNEVFDGATNEDGYYIY